MQRALNFFSELVRRKVVRLLGAYIVILWVLAQGLASLFPAFGLSNELLQILIYAGIALIPVIAWLSWRYDITPPQLVRDPQDIEAANPGLSWAMRRHDNSDAGFVLLKWQAKDDNGNEKTHEKRFFKAISIGRGPDNDVQLIDERVSRHHAVFWAEGGTWHLRDYSTNGTFINHQRVTEPVELSPSCEIQFHPNGPTVSIHIDKPAKTMAS